MSKQIVFKNPETDVNLTLDLDKEFIVVFGKNGAGKTTISRHAPDQDCVFNTDFIHRNIYVETSNGAADNADTKEAFSGLWVGETIVKLKKELENLKMQNAEIVKLKTSLSTSILKTFSEKGVPPINCSEIDKSLETISFVKSSEKSDAEIIKEYKGKLILKSSILDEDGLQQAITRLKNNELLQLLIKELKSNAFLNEIFLTNNSEEKDVFSKHLKTYDGIFKDLKTYDEAFKSKDKRKEEQWIKDAIELHETADHCYFCDGTNVKDALKKWKSITEAKLKEEVNSIIKYINNIEKTIENILKHKDSMIKIANKSVQTLEKLYRYLNIIDEKISLRDEIKEDIIFPAIEKDELVTEENELLKNVQSYMFKKYSDEYEILFLLLKDYSSKIKNKDSEIEKEMNLNAESITKSIDSHLEDLDFDKELKITVDKRGNEKKYKFGFINSSTKISTLSDGQKHKLALAIFFARIENLDLTNKVVVLDDPIVTLDYRSYHAVKRKIIKLRAEKKPSCVLLLTCNIDYLYVQLTNLFNKPDITDTKMIHLTSKSITEVDYNIINYDDLSLYQNSLLQMTNASEFNLAASLNVRIYRMFLDLYLRIHGYPSNGNPKNEILSITGIDEETRKHLLDNNLYIEEFCRKTSALNYQLFETFSKTNEFITLLGFPSIIDKTTFEKLKEYKNSNVRELKYSGTNLLFLIIRRASAIFNSTDSKYKCIKDYLNHPRTQLTSSIVGVDFSDLEVDSM